MMPEQRAPGRRFRPLVIIGLAAMATFLLSPPAGRTTSVPLVFDRPPESVPTRTPEVATSATPALVAVPPAWTLDDSCRAWARPAWEGAVDLAASMRGPVVSSLIVTCFRKLPNALRLALGEEVPVVNPAITASACEFLSHYRQYTSTVNRELALRLGPAPSARGARELTRLRRGVSRRHAAQYRRAMAAADRHLSDFAQGLGKRVRDEPTYLLVRKSEFLVYLVGAERNEVYAVFPVGIGTLSGQKERRGDLKTPECPPSKRTVTETPFHAGPLVPTDPFPTAGVITRGIGVSSNDPEFGFLERGWLIMFHGTPNQDSMGTRSSLGCIRLLPRHIAVLFDHVHPNSKVVITP